MCGRFSLTATPEQVRELLARVRSVLRRLPPPVEKPADTKPKLTLGNYVNKYEVPLSLTYNGMEIEISSMDFDLLETFARHPRQVLSRDRLCELAHGRSLQATDRSLDIRIARLRKKIETDASDPTILRTVRGEGYVFEPEG